MKKDPFASLAIVLVLQAEMSAIKACGLDQEAEDNLAREVLARADGLMPGLARLVQLGVTLDELRDVGADGTPEALRLKAELDNNIERVVFGEG